MGIQILSFIGHLTNMLLPTSLCGLHAASVYTVLASHSEVDCYALVYVSYNNCPEPLLREDNDKFEIFSPGKEAVVKM